MKQKVVFGVVILILAGLLAYYNLREHKNAQDVRVRASGTVEVTEIQIAPLVGGRIVFLELDEGDFVGEGELVCKLSLDGLDSQEKAHTAAIKRERERLRELENGSRPEEIARGAADLKAREAQYEQAKRDARRYDNLLAQNAVSKKEAELYRENERVMLESRNASRESYELLKKGPREETVSQQVELINQLEAELEVIRLNLSYKDVFSPAAGMVLSKNFQRGEVASPGTPILNIGSVDDLWVKVYIPATQLDRIVLGQSADIYVDSPPQKALPGRVKAVAQQAEYNPRLSLTQHERANQVFWVKVSVLDNSGRVKPGMPADVVFSPAE